jgi:hypothetical protein
MKITYARATTMFVIFFLVCLPAAHATDYFVSPSGSDTGGDGSLGNPWQTIAFALEQVQPGDALYLRAGEYHEQLMTVRDGVPSAPITIAAYEGEAAYIDGDGVESGNNGCLISHSYTILRGFAVRNWRDDGVAVYNCSYLHIVKLTVRDVGAGISMKGTVHDFLVDSCMIFDYYGGAGGYGFDATPEGSGERIYNGLIRNCKAYITAGAFDNADGFALGHDGVSDIRFHNCETYGIGDGFDISGTDIVLTNCSAHNATYGGGYKLWRNNVTMINCIGYDNGVNVELDYDGGVNQGVNARLINCTFHGCSNANIAIENTAGGSTLEMYNCILSGGDNTGLNFDGLNIQCYTGDYNLFHMNAPGRAVATSDLDYSLAQIQNGEWTAATGQDAHSVVAYDAHTLYADSARTRPDLHLRAGSPAINGGGAVTGVPTEDFDGTPRGDGFVDIGAFEFSTANGIDAEESDPSAGQFTIDDMYPNPVFTADQHVTVTFSVPRSTGVTLTLVDAAGRLIARRYIDAPSPGRYQAHFPSSALASGQYTCVLSSGSIVLGKTLLAIR